MPQMIQQIPTGYYVGAIIALVILLLVLCNRIRSNARLYRHNLETAIKEHEMAAQRNLDAIVKEHELAVSLLKSKIAELQPYYDKYACIPDAQAEVERILSDASKEANDTITKACQEAAREADRRNALSAECELIIRTTKTSIADALLKAADQIDHFTVASNLDARSSDSEKSGRARDATEHEAAIRVATIESQRQEATKSDKEVADTEYVPPQNIDGMALSYSYDEGFFIPAELALPTQGIAVGTLLSARHEPNNAYDSLAIALYCDGRQIGYFYKGKMRDMVHDYMDRADKRVLIAMKKWDSSKPLIGLFFYKEQIDEVFDGEYGQLLESKRFRRFTLTGNKSEEMQEAIMSCTIGQSVDIAYDDDKEKYDVAADSFIIGYMPSSARELLDANCDRAAFIDSIETNDSLKYVVQIIVEI